LLPSARNLFYPCAYGVLTVGFLVAASGNNSYDPTSTHPALPTTILISLLPIPRKLFLSNISSQSSSQIRHHAPCYSPTASKYPPATPATTNHLTTLHLSSHPRPTPHQPPAVAHNPTTLHLPNPTIWTFHFYCSTTQLSTAPLCFSTATTFSIQYILSKTNPVFDFSEMRFTIHCCCLQFGLFLLLRCFAPAKDCMFLIAASGNNS
jgi:hypothetical protein